MVPGITGSHKRYRLNSCPHCGGSLYWDEEEEEWICLNCAWHPEVVSTTDNSVSGKKIPISTTETPLKSAETPAISKRLSPRRQMLSLIKNLPQLREEHSSIADEVEARLKRAGLDGFILLAIECWGESEASLAKYLAIPSWSIKKRYKRALAYISGWKRKKQSYKEFLRQKLAV